MLQLLSSGRERKAPTGAAAGRLAACVQGGLYRSSTKTREIPTPTSYH